MDNRYDRPDERMRDVVDGALRRLDDTGDRQAAAELWRARVRLRVIVRVLREPRQRRRVSP